MRQTVSDQSLIMFLVSPRYFYWLSGTEMIVMICRSENPRIYSHFPQQQVSHCRSHLRWLVQDGDQPLSLYHERSAAFKMIALGVVRYWNSNILVSFVLYMWQVRSLVSCLNSHLKGSMFSNSVLMISPEILSLEMCRRQKMCGQSVLT